MYLAGFVILAAEYTTVSGFQIITVDRWNLGLDWVFFFLIDVIIACTFVLCPFQPFGKGLLYLGVVVIRYIYPLRVILSIRINYMV